MYEARSCSSARASISQSFRHLNSPIPYEADVRDITRETTRYLLTLPLLTCKGGLRHHIMQLGLRLREPMSCSCCCAGTDRPITKYVRPYRHAARHGQRGLVFCMPSVVSHQSRSSHSTRCDFQMLPPM